MNMLNILEALMYDTRTVEFQDQNSQMMNIKKAEKGKIGKYANGDAIKLDRNFLNANWALVENNKTLTEALEEAQSLQHTVLVSYKYEPLWKQLTSWFIDKDSSLMADLTLKNIAEEKSFSVLDNDYEYQYSDFEPMSPNNAYAIRCTEAISGLLKEGENRELVHDMNPNLRIYLSKDGNIKHRFTKEIVTLSTALMGFWNFGDVVTETESEPMKLATAGKIINWEKQNLYFNKGMSNEVIITKHSYENSNIGAILGNNVSVKDILLNDRWTVVDK